MCFPLVMSYWLMYGRFRAKLEIKDLSGRYDPCTNLGPVSVSGLTIAGAETRLRQELSQIMSTLSGSGEGNTFVSVSLSQIRSMKVNIVGEVVAPGTYTLPSFCHII